MHHSKVVYDKVKQSQKHRIPRPRYRQAPSDLLPTPYCNRATQAWHGAYHSQAGQRQVPWVGRAASPCHDHCRQQIPHGFRTKRGDMNAWSGISLPISMVRELRFSDSPNLARTWPRFPTPVCESPCPRQPGTRREASKRKEKKNPSKNTAPATSPFAGLHLEPREGTTAHGCSAQAHQGLNLRISH